MLGWDAPNDAPGGYITSYNGSRRDNRIRPDRHPWKKRRSQSDEDIVLNRDATHHVNIWVLLA